MCDVLKFPTRDELTQFTKAQLLDMLADELAE